MRLAIPTAIAVALQLGKGSSTAALRGPHALLVNFGSQKGLLGYMQSQAIKVDCFLM